MGKNDMVRQYQTARLAEWAGDLATAEQIYAELEKRHEGLARLMKPSVEERKRATLDRTLLYEQRQRAARHRVDLVNQASLRVDHAQLPAILTTWKYSVFVVAKSDDNLLRLAIRGYGPEGVQPPLTDFRGIQAPEWEIERETVEPEQAADGGDLLWISGRTFDPNVQAYVSVDRWGLLSGSALAEERQLGDALAKIHSLIAAFGNGWAR